MYRFKSSPNENNISVMPFKITFFIISQDLKIPVCESNFFLISLT